MLRALRRPNAFATILSLLKMFYEFPLITFEPDVNTHTRIILSHTSVFNGGDTKLVLPCPTSSPCSPNLAPSDFGLFAQITSGKH